jgi:hypothetical protein
MRNEKAARLLKFSKKFNVPVIATNDSHYTNQDDYNAHDILLCINTGEKLATPALREFTDDDVLVKNKRFAFPNDQFYFKTTAEMSKLFQDKRVRQAMALSLNRPDIVQGLFQGKAEVGNDSPFAPVFASTDTSVPQRAQDIAKAKQLLQTAGMTSVNVTLTTEQFLEIPQYAQYVKQMAAPAGFNITLDVQPQTKFYGTGAAIDFARATVFVQKECCPRFHNQQVVVEIRSPNDESEDKLPFFAQIGVLEVWIIDRDTKDIDLYVLTGDSYVRRAAGDISPNRRLNTVYLPHLAVCEADFPADEFLCFTDSAPILERDLGAQRPDGRGFRATSVFNSPKSGCRIDVRKERDHVGTQDRSAVYRQGRHRRRASGCVGLFHRRSENVLRSVRRHDFLWDDAALVFGLGPRGTCRLRQG